MRALTLTQPWAGLVASGIKLVENRPRRMIARADFGKRFAIHASREIDNDTYASISCLAPELRGDILRHRQAAWYDLSRITSAVIAVATLDKWIEHTGDGEPMLSAVAEAVLPLDQRRWFFGPIGYVLRDVIALPTAVPCRGWQGFWTLPDDVAAKLEEQLR